MHAEPHPYPPAADRVREQRLDPARAWQRQSSVLARWFFVVYLAVVIDASLYPFTGWVDIGVKAFDYLDAPWPRTPFEFDLVVNVLAYLPLGFLGVAALYPRLRSIPAAVLTALFCAATSALLEAAQTFLPTRVASRVDLITNILGALIGIVIGLAVTERLLDRGRLRQLRLVWFERDASAALVLGAFWFAALLYPQRYAIGCGALLLGLGSNWDAALATEAWLAALWPASTGWFTAIDALVCASYLCAAVLIILDSARANAPRFVLLLLCVICTVFAKTLGTGLTYASAEPFIWVTPGSIIGFGAASAAATVLMAAPRATRRVAIIGLLAIALILANAGPDNPYLEALPGAWQRGRLLNFYGLALGLSAIWPLCALVAMAWPRRQSARPIRGAQSRAAAIGRQR